MCQRNKSKSIAQVGVVSNLLLAAIASIAAVAILCCLAITIRPDARINIDPEKTVRIYCAAGVAEPIEQFSHSFNQQSDYQAVIARIGGSGEMAGQIKMEFETKVSNSADLFITNDEQLLKQQSMKGVFESQFTLASQRPVVAVAANNGFSLSEKSVGIPGLLDSNDVKFGIASKRAAIGSLSRKIAAEQNVLSELEQKKTLDAENVMVLAQALVAGSLDAAVVWDTTVNQINAQSQRQVLSIIGSADPTGRAQGLVAVGVVSGKNDSTGVKAFTQFLIAGDQGKPVFESFGFEKK